MQLTTCAQEVYDSQQGKEKKVKVSPLSLLHLDQGNEQTSYFSRNLLASGCYNCKKGFVNASRPRCQRFVLFPSKLVLFFFVLSRDNCLCYATAVDAVVVVVQPCKVALAMTMRPTTIPMHVFVLRRLPASSGVAARLLPPKDADFHRITFLILLFLYL